MNTIDKLIEFHTLFGPYTGHSIADKPTIPSDKVCKARVKFLREELAELEEAIATNNMIEILDALTDIQYFLDGTYLVFGLHELKSKAFAEVHRSNMTKICKDGRILRDELTGKVLKPHTYEPPNLKQFIMEQLQPSPD